MNVRRPISWPTALRWGLGRLYFSGRRFLAWHFSGRSFCSQFSGEPLPCLHASHASPFWRPLKNVDAYLQENKKNNIRLASSRLNGLIIRPNENFSFWRLVGLPTRLKGYKEGLVLRQGALGRGIGGGLCQLSNLLYWLTLHTPLQVIERWRHSYDVFPDVERSLPFGSGATVAYNYIDLQIANPTAQPFQLLLRQDEEKLYGEWRSASPPKQVYKIIEKNHRIESCLHGYIRRNELHRQVNDLASGDIIEEFITANNALMMYNPLLTGGEK